MSEDFEGVSNESQPPKLENSPYYSLRPLGAANYKSEVNTTHHLHAPEIAIAQKSDISFIGVNFTPCVLIWVYVLILFVVTRADMSLRVVNQPWC